MFCNSFAASGNSFLWKELSVDTAVAELTIFGQSDFDLFRTDDPFIVSVNHEGGWLENTL